MSKVFSIVAIAIGALVVADIWTHPAGTKAASTGAGNLWGTTVRGIVGK